MGWRSSAWCLCCSESVSSDRQTHTQLVQTKMVLFLKQLIQVLIWGCEAASCCESVLGASRAWRLDQRGVMFFYATASSLSVSHSSILKKEEAAEWYGMPRCKRTPLGLLPLWSWRKWWSKVELGSKTLAHDTHSGHGFIGAGETQPHKKKKKKNSSHKIVLK